MTHTYAKRIMSLAPYVAGLVLVAVFSVYLATDHLKKTQIALMDVGRIYAGLLDRLAHQVELVYYEQNTLLLSTDRTARYLHERRLALVVLEIKRTLEDIEQIEHLLDPAGLSRSSPPVRTLVEQVMGLHAAIAQQAQTQPDEALETSRRDHYSLTGVVAGDLRKRSRDAADQAFAASDRIYQQTVRTLLGILAFFFLMVFLLTANLMSRRRAQAEARRAEQRYHTLVQNLPGVVYHAEHNGNRTMHYISPEIERFAGYTPDDLMEDRSISFASLIHPEDRDRVDRIVARAVEEHSAYEVAYRIVTASGAERWVFDHGQPVASDVRSEGVLLDGVIVDMTAERQTQDLVNSKNEELEQIVYAVSHDLRSPLVNIDGYGREIEYVLEELDGALEEELPAEQVRDRLHAVLPDLYDSLGHVRSSARQMDRLLKGLLKLSRLGRAALAIKAVDMNALVARVTSSVQFELDAAGAKLTSGPLPPCIGDDVLLTQVISNLVDNAIKFLDSTRPGLIALSGRVERGRSIYCVADNGIGIAPQYHEHVFGLFHRLDPAASKGEGLGLALVRRILGRLDGEIRLESSAGQGCRFTVSLPSLHDEGGAADGK